MLFYFIWLRLIFSIFILHDFFFFFFISLLLQQRFWHLNYNEPMEQQLLHAPRSTLSSDDYCSFLALPECSRRKLWKFQYIRNKLFSNNSFEFRFKDEPVPGNIVNKANISRPSSRISSTLFAALLAAVAPGGLESSANTHSHVEWNCLSINSSLHLHIIQIQADTTKHVVHTHIYI